MLIFFDGAELTRPVLVDQDGEGLHSLPKDEQVMPVAGALDAAIISPHPLHGLLVCLLGQPVCSEMGLDFFNPE